MAKQTQIDRAIEQLEAKVAGMQEAIAVLRQQQARTTSRRPRVVARVLSHDEEVPRAPRS